MDRIQCGLMFRWQILRESSTWWQGCCSELRAIRDCRWPQELRGQDGFVCGFQRNTGLLTPQAQQKHEANMFLLFWVTYWPQQKQWDKYISIVLKSLLSPVMVEHLGSKNSKSKLLSMVMTLKRWRLVSTLGFGLRMLHRKVHSGTPNLKGWNPKPSCPRCFRERTSWVTQRRRQFTELYTLWMSQFSQIESRLSSCNVFCLLQEWQPKALLRASAGSNR